jgi:hypothetical protein
VKQSRRMSLVEAVTSVAIGYGVAVTANVLVLPWFGFPVSLSDAALIGAVFTVIAVVRSYVVRRLFETWRPGATTSPALFVTVRSPTPDHPELVVGLGGHDATVYPLTRPGIERLAVEATAAAWKR